MTPNQDLINIASLYAAHAAARTANPNWSGQAVGECSTTKTAFAAEYRRLLAAGVTQDEIKAVCQ